MCDIGEAPLAPVMGWLLIAWYTFAMTKDLRIS
jgi:hypothetical protein